MSVCAWVGRGVTEDRRDGTLEIFLCPSDNSYPLIYRIFKVWNHILCRKFDTIDKITVTLKE